VNLNPNLPEAVCGLVSSMISVCDWRGRESTAEECGLDDSGEFIPPGSVSQSLATPSLMSRMLTICQSQLDAAYSQNLNCVSAARPLAEWLRIVAVAFDRPLTQAESYQWHVSFQRFYGNKNRQSQAINECGFIIRFIDWIVPRLQRRWYLKVYGKSLASDQVLVTDPHMYSELFHRPTLPRTMSPPIVPSVLPFNTVRKIISCVKPG
jgi:protein O-GlcNAc transferase